MNSTLFHRNVQRDIWLGNPKLHCDFEDKNMLTKSQSSWTAISMAIQSREKVLRDWLVSGVLRSGKKESSWTVLEIPHMDLGIPMNVEIQSGSSLANSLTDRLGAGSRMKQTDAQFCWCTRTRSRWRSQCQEGSYCKNCAEFGTIQSPLQY